MSTSPSGTDEDNIERYAAEGLLWSIITNKTGASAALRGFAVPTDGIYIRADFFDVKNPSDKRSPFRYTIEGCRYLVQPRAIAMTGWLKTATAAVKDAAPVGRGNSARGTARWDLRLNAWVDQAGKPVDPLAAKYLWEDEDKDDATLAEFGYHSARTYYPPGQRGGQQLVPVQQQAQVDKPAPADAANPSAAPVAPSDLPLQDRLEAAWRQTNTREAKTGEKPEVATPSSRPTPKDSQVAWTAVDERDGGRIGTHPAFWDDRSYDYSDHTYNWFDQAPRNVQDTIDFLLTCGSVTQEFVEELAEHDYAHASAVLSTIVSDTDAEGDERSVGSHVVIDELVGAYNLEQAAQDDATQFDTGGSE